MHLIQLLYESMAMAASSLKANKLRSVLSLLGITIGIFSIISVFSLIESLERQIRNSLDQTGGGIIYIEKWPWTPPKGEIEYPYWRYQNRPNSKLAETEKLLKRTNIIENAVFQFKYKRTVESGSNNISNVTIMATTYGLMDVWDLKINKGRYFTVREMHSGIPVAVIGHEISNLLFPKTNPIGKYIKVQDYKFLIIGIYEKKGKDIFNNSMDNNIHISAVKSFYMIDIHAQNQGQSICVKGKQNIEDGRFKLELEGIMRSIRKLNPMEENNFALNEVSLFSNNLEQFFSSINILGSIIGGFSILIGGFGVAIIMYVAVDERTKIIGIQKALGAKKYFILFQFIFEAILLSVLGGLVGLVLIYLGTIVIAHVSEFTIILTVYNVIRGILISSVIGFVAGFMPALSAAKLDPSVAINSL